jgi:hypothetical protein
MGNLDDDRSAGVTSGGRLTRFLNLLTMDSEMGV